MNKKSKLQQNQLVSNAFQSNAFLGFIVVFTLMLFSKCIQFQFVFYDDPEYITGNNLLKNLNLEGIYKIFTTPVIGMYNPLPFLVYAIEYYFWGFNPKYFHLTNLLFHLVAITTVYYFILLISKRVETALIVALLFAVHPMHTGVVIWASQLKTSMYLVFYFLGLSQYVIYVDKDHHWKRLVNTFLFFFFR